MKIYVNTKYQRWGTGSVGAPQQQHEILETEFDALISGTKVIDYGATKTSGKISIISSPAVALESRITKIETQIAEIFKITAIISK